MYNKNMFSNKFFIKFLPLLLICNNLVSCSFIKDSSTFSKKTNNDDKVTITWNDGNGNEIYSEKLKYGDMPSYSSSVIPIKNPTTQYTYTFNNSWEPEIQTATTDMVYTAQFDTTLKKYRVNWFDDDHLIKFSEYEYGQLPSFDGEIPQVKPGTEDYEYRFVGWEPAISAVTCNIDYHSKYEKHNLKEIYTLTFEFNNGEEKQVFSYKEGDTITYPTNPSKQGYEFISWDHDFTTMPDYNLTIRAIYSLKAPGLYIYENINSYRNNSIYNSYIPFNELVNNDYINLTGNQINSCSSSYFNSNTTRVLTLILPNNITKISNISNLTRLIELHINTNTTVSLDNNCFSNNTLLENVFFAGEGVILFPGYNSIGNLTNGNFSKSLTVFSKCTSLNKIIFNNKQKILSTGSLSNDDSTLTVLVLPDSLTNLYFYEFYNTTNSSNTYSFISGVGISYLSIPEELKVFHYINTSNPLKLLTNFVFLGGNSTWDSINKVYFYFKNSTSLNNSNTLPNGFNITYSK